jgi:hypothetical protein
LPQRRDSEDDSARFSARLPYIKAANIPYIADCELLRKSESAIHFNKLRNLLTIIMQLRRNSSPYRIVEFDR